MVTGLSVIAAIERIWNGAIPVRVVCDEREVYLAVSRVLYLPLYFDVLASHFSIGDKPIWLENSGVPLQWHIPTGVLYDARKLPDLTWQLQLHCTDYPEHHVIPLQANGYSRQLKAVYMNQLKQALYVLHGNSKAVMGMSPARSEKLWRAVERHDWGDYSACSADLVPTAPRRVPVKIYAGAGVILAPVGPDEGLRQVLEANAVEKAVILIQGIDVSFLVDEDATMLQIWQLFKHVDHFLHITIKVPS